jgi:hypothetical protein
MHVFAGHEHASSMLMPGIYFGRADDDKLHYRPGLIWFILG